MIDKIGKPAAIALGLLALGFIMIGVAWNGAASKNSIQQQFPYMLSGGIAGLGLIVLGAGLLLFESGRRMLLRLEERFEQIAQALGSAGAAGATPEDDETGAIPPLAAMNGMYVVGRSSFHTGDCRLVVGKTGMEIATQDEAAARGLQPCRVCDPLSLASRKN